jgi:16S rRNA (adenine1518-N6/adenine1519-N6)-dimethyltransferase
VAGKKPTSSGKPKVDGNPVSDTIPKKSLGQHWLHDEDSLLAMCDAGLVHHHDTVLEIGPGLGTLTKLLVQKAAQVIAVEFDEQLARDLPTAVPAVNLRVIHSDILKLDLTQLPVGYKVIANIPYYLTSNLLRTLSESSNPPKMIALLVQKEVAERVCAGPGSMSLLSVSVQMYYDAALDRVVKAELFTPPPKVDSQIVQLVRRPEPLFGDRDSKHVFRIVKAGFSNRRKTLLNSLSAGLRLSKDETGAYLAAAVINPMARPQELSLEQWLALADTIKL